MIKNLEFIPDDPDLNAVTRSYRERGRETHRRANSGKMGQTLERCAHKPWGAGGAQGGLSLRAEAGTTVLPTTLVSDFWPQVL